MRILPILVLAAGCSGDSGRVTDLEKRVAALEAEAVTTKKTLDAAADAIKTGAEAQVLLARSQWSCNDLLCWRTDEDCARVGKGRPCRRQRLSYCGRPIPVGNATAPDEMCFASLDECSRFLRSGSLCHGVE